jgi:hypothetical protein
MPTSEVQNLATAFDTATMFLAHPGGQAVDGVDLCHLHIEIICFYVDTQHMTCHPEDRADQFPTRTEDRIHSVDDPTRELAIRRSVGHQETRPLPVGAHEHQIFFGRMLLEFVDPRRGFDAKTLSVTADVETQHLATVEYQLDRSDVSLDFLTANVEHAVDPGYHPAHTRFQERRRAHVIHSITFA